MLCWTYASKTETKKDNPGELCSSYRFFPQAKRDNLGKSATNQRLKLKCSVAFAHIISRNILIRVLLKQRFSKV